MKADRWLEENTDSLVGKTIAVTGTTGGLGKALCRDLAKLGASLILLDRNSERSQAFARELTQSFAGLRVQCKTVDLEDFSSVKRATKWLQTERIDCFLHNAGAYSILRHRCDTGFENVFQINFLSPYYMIRELLPALRAVGGRVVVVGSIAHNYSKTDPADLDFSSQRQDCKVYGNAKRYLMFSLFELFREERKVSLSVTHPGISFTNITAHYPKLIFAMIKYPMKLIFMKPAKACLPILRGVFEACGDHEWIGPRWFQIWGLPKKTLLKTCTIEESTQIGQIADRIYRALKE